MYSGLPPHKEAVIVGDDGLPVQLYILMTVYLVNAEACGGQSPPQSTHLSMQQK